MGANLIRFIFEKIPMLNSLDGYKRLFGRIAMFVSAVLIALNHYFPEIPHVADVNGYIALFFSYIGFEVGNIHAAAKAK